MNDSPTALVHAKGLRKDYGSGEGLVRALDMVDLEVNRALSVTRHMSATGTGQARADCSIDRARTGSHPS